MILLTSNKNNNELTTLFIYSPLVRAGELLLRLGHAACVGGSDRAPRRRSNGDALDAEGDVSRRGVGGRDVKEGGQRSV
jgi:hypothetical protein